MNKLQTIFFTTILVLTGCTNNDEYCGTELMEIEEKPYKELMGYKLFQSNCASCHSVERDLVGTSLKKIIEKREISWITEFINKEQKVIIENTESDVAEVTIKHPSTIFTEQEIDSFEYFLKKLK